jgi:hypothetical protein
LHGVVVGDAAYRVDSQIDMFACHVSLTWIACKKCTVIRNANCKGLH